MSSKEELDKEIKEKEADLKKMAEKLALLNNELHDVFHSYP